MAILSPAAAELVVNWPSGWVLLALAPLVVLLLGLIAFCLVDLVRAPSVRLLPKAVWALIIVLFSAPFGAILYLAVGRVPRSANRPTPDGAPGPECDPVADPINRPDEGLIAPRPSGTSAAAAPPAQRPTVAVNPDQPLVGPAIAVRTSGLTRDYGGTGLFDVDLIVPRGCVYGLVGPNGAGKTTMLSIISGMRRADRGSVRIAVPHNAIAVCPDVPEFDGWLTAREVVELARALIGADRADPGTAALADPVTAALGAAGLAADADRRVSEFSRGMTQRLGLACAMAGDPQLLIFDEPTSALDPAGRSEVLDLVSGMRGQRTVIFSSHILADVQRVADQVGVLRDGRLLYQGPTQALIDTHLQPRWLIRVAEDATVLRAALGTQPWVTRVDPIGADAIRLEATSLEAGERGIPAVLAECHERLVSCEPVAADLEAAFLALTVPDLQPSR